MHLISTCSSSVGGNTAGSGKWLQKGEGGREGRTERHGWSPTSKRGEVYSSTPLLFSPFVTMLGDKILKRVH